MKVAWLSILALAAASEAFADSAAVELNLPWDAVEIRLGKVQEELRPKVDEECLERSKTLGPFDDLGVNCRVWVKTGLWAVSISFERQGMPSADERQTETFSFDPAVFGYRAGSKAWKGFEKRLEFQVDLVWVNEVHAAPVVWEQQDSEPSWQGPSREIPWQRLQVTLRLKD